MVMVGSNLRKVSRHILNMHNSGFFSVLLWVVFGAFVFRYQGMSNIIWALARVKSKKFEIVDLVLDAKSFEHKATR